MDYKQVLYFKTITEEGTMSKAAKKLKTSQPSISKQLQALEKDLGVTLMKRGGRSIELTEAGKTFYKRCLQILSLTELTFTEMQNYNRCQILQIGLTSSNIDIMLRPSTDVFFKNHPDTTYEIFEGNTYDIITKVKSHLIDIAFVRTPFNSADLEVMIIKNDPMLAVGFDKFLESNLPISLPELCRNPLIIHRRYNDLFMDTCLKHHVSPKILCHTDDCRTSLMWAQKGKGTAIVPASACEMLTSRTLRTRIIKSAELTTSIAVIWRKDSYFTPLQLEFINCFK